MYKLTQINIYPVKSLGGISLQSSQVEERGLKYDRRWMLVYENGKFFTQRDHPQMALLKPVVENDRLSILHKNDKFPMLAIPEQPDGNKILNVTVWDDECAAKTYRADVDEWFSKALGFRCKLVYMPDSTKRIVNTKFAQNKSVGFADAFPFLIIGEESLNDLNRRMETPVAMNRFRTNFAFSGGEPFDEDNWKKIKIGSVAFQVVKPCARCTITTIDQNTGEKGKEPLTTLAKFRKINGGVMFGQNMVAGNTGIITVGDKIETEYK